jgi:transcriptional regulator with XRE-family HTH domain
MEVNAIKIKSLRTQRNWTQQHLADACAISLRTVQRVERYGNASKDTLMGLTAVFELESSDLVVASEPVVIIEKVVDFDNKRERKLILSATTIGISIGVTVMLLINGLT